MAILRFPSVTRTSAARLCLLAALLASVASAQNAPKYRELPIVAKFKTSRAISQAKLVKDGVILGRYALSDKRAEFLEWYSGYQFRRLTRHEFFHEMDKIRSELLKDLRGARAPEVHDVLTDTYLRLASVICKDANYYPASRVNAMLLIASLNQTEETARAPAVPYARSLSFMLDQLNDDRQLDAVKAVALVGILRHIKLALVNPAYTLSVPQRDQILAAMRAVLKQPKPDTRSPEAHAWLQRRAMESAVLVADLNKNPEILQELASLIESKEASPLLVCATAQAVGRLRVPRNLQYDPLPLAQRLGAAVVQAVEREAKRLAEQEKKPGSDTMLDGYGGMAGMMGGGRPPGGEASDEDENSPYGDYGGGDEKEDKPKEDVPESPPEVTRVRRLLKYQIVCVLEGLRGPARSENLGLLAMAAGDAAKQAELKKIADAIDAVLAATDPKNPDDAFASTQELLKAVQERLTELEALLPESVVEGEEADKDKAQEDATPAEPGGDEPGGDEPGGDDPSDTPAGAAGGQAGDGNKKQ